MFPATITEKLPAAVVKQAFSLSADDRQTLFLDYVEKAEAIWLLKGTEGFVMIAGEEGERLPVWPHFDLAKAWNDDAQGGVEAVSISLAQFKEDWLPGLGKNNIELVLCPNRLEEEDSLLTFFFFCLGDDLSFFLLDDVVALLDLGLSLIRFSTILSTNEVVVVGVVTLLS